MSNDIKNKQRVKISARPQTLRELETLNRITAVRIATQDAIRAAESKGYRRGVEDVNHVNLCAARKKRRLALVHARYDILSLIIIFFVWLIVCVAALMLLNCQILPLFPARLILILLTGAALFAAGWLLCDLYRNK